MNTSSPAPLTLHLDNLRCGSCAARAERALGAVPGVTGAEVNPTTGQARIAGAADPAALAAALTEAGYPARLMIHRLTVGGLSCASCVGRAERALAALPGVVAANVNLAAGTARVEAFEGAVDDATLARALEQAGYAADPQTAEAPSDPVARQEAEARDLRRDVIVAAALTLPVFLIEMGGHMIPALHHWVEMTIGRQTSWLIQFVLVTAVLAWPGFRFHRHGWPALWRGAPDMNALVALGTAAAWGYSTVATFAPGLLPAGTQAVYYEAAAMIVTLILLGRWLEARARGRTGAAIARLSDLAPSVARLRRDGGAVEVPAADLRPGDVVEIRPGDRLPADGEIVEGKGWIDESMLTGEPVPAAKAPGDAVTGGTVNGAAALAMRVTRTGRDTALAQIIAMVEQAQAARLPIQALVNRVTLWFVPAVIAVAALTVAIWLAIGPDPRLSYALVAGVAVLIVACPCAMGLATPTSIMVGTGRAADLGILFRRGDALQALQDVRVVAFDKTGTLTLGRPDLTGIAAAPGWSEDDVLANAAAIEAGSEHPIARAIAAAGTARGLRLPTAEAVTATPGSGVTGTVAGREVMVGAPHMLDEAGIDTAPLHAHADSWAEAGHTVVMIAVDGQPAGILGVSDPVRPTAKAAIAALIAEGVEVAMISGDSPAAARAVADRLGIAHVTAGVRPAGKVAAIEALRAAHGPVAFVGDGLNDAPALAAADIGIAIGTGTDVAVEAADVVLMRADPGAVATALHLSRATLRNIRQNLVWAFGYNTALVPVAAGVLYPAFGMLLSPVLAAGAMALSSVFVVGNALRLGRAVAAPPAAAPSDPAPHLQPAE